MKNRQIAVCPSRSWNQTCGAATNMWKAGTKPMSYALNTLETWSVTGWPNTNKYGLRRPNTLGVSLNEAEIEDPTGTIWLVDSQYAELFNEGSLDYVAASTPQVRRHMDGFNAAYVDGHTRWLKAGSTNTTAWSLQSD